MLDTLTTYGRAALPLVPFADRLPFVAGGGGAMPEGPIVQHDVRTDLDHLAQFARVCGFRVGSTLPVTYPHALAFDMHMGLMIRGDFPIPAIGLVHVENTITQHRPIGTGEPFELTLTPTPLRPHAKGEQFDLRTDARIDGELVWEERSTFLRRGREHPDAARGQEVPSALQLPERALWTLPGDLGRRYGAVAGDRNPIHLTALTAKAFGFPSAIAHGMWTASRALGALEGRLPDAYTVAVAFKRPIPLPGRVVFATTPTETRTADGPIGFGVRSRQGAPHLDGLITPHEESN